MQTVFAYRQCKEANYANALDNIRQEFLPDLNSMDPQDPHLLAEQGKEAQILFKKYVFSEFQSINEGSNERINTVAFNEIKEYHKANDKDRRFLKAQMIQDSEKIYHFYILCLLALLDFRSFAERDKKINHKSYINNRVLKSLEKNNDLHDVAVRNNLTWETSESPLKQWFKDLVKSDEQYLEYIKIEEPSFEDDKGILIHLIKQVLFNKDSADVYWQEKDLHWAEDRAIVLSMAKKTIKDVEKDSHTLELQVLSYNWEEDKDFFKELYEESLKAAEDHTEMIAAKTSNWDVDRLAATDRIIIEMAIAEMLNFPSIPVKVTINEYIEISKRYSTPKSKQFINGVLDVISKELKEKGLIRKSGRGLIDNN